MVDKEGSIEMAQKFLEDILSFFGLNTVVKSSVDEDVIELKVPTSHLNGFLIGQHGETLRALQALVSTMLKSNEATLNRVNIDVADYKQQRADNLRKQVEDWVEKVRKEEKPYPLKPMNSADRRTVHKSLEGYGDVVSRSEGEGRERRIVIELK